MELDLQGSIERFTLPEIFQLIAAGRKSGTLGIQKDDFIVMVYFSEGEIIYGYGPRQTYHLGQLLKEKNVISAQQLEKAIKLQAENENSKRLGEILIGQNFIDRADLEKVITTQIQDLLYSLLSWETGTFKFYENQFPTDEEIKINISVENVILEGLRRADEKNFVRETLDSVETVYTLTSAQGGRSRDVKLEADEWNVMALVDGHRSLIQICKASQLDEQKAMMVMAKLKLAGIIGKTDRKAVSESNNLENMTNRLAHLFEDYLTAKTVTPTKNPRLTTELVENEK